jgi:hypothetical protein
VSGGQHAGLSEEQWASFTLDQQILMIGNEMNRASKLLEPAHRESLRNCYERVLRLVDLTVAFNSKRTLRRELLLWRDVIVALYSAPDPDRIRHEAAFRCLLRFTPAASQQIPHVLPSPATADAP